MHRRTHTCNQSVIPKHWESFPSVPWFGISRLPDIILAYKSLHLAPGPPRWDSWMRLIWQPCVFFLAHQLGPQLGNRGGKMCLRGCCKLHCVQREGPESHWFLGLKGCSSQMRDWLYRPLKCCSTALYVYLFYVMVIFSSSLCIVY